MGANIEGHDDDIDILQDEICKYINKLMGRPI